MLVALGNSTTAIIPVIAVNKDAIVQTAEGAILSVGGILALDQNVMIMANGNYIAGDMTPDGKTYTNQGTDQANSRGFTSEEIDKIIQNNFKKRVKEIDKQTGRTQWR